VSKKRSLLDSIPWFRTAEADTDVDTTAEEEAQQDGDQKPTEDSEETITVEQLVEQVRAAVLEEVRAQIEPMVEIIREMDGFIRTHDETLAHLVQDDATKVKDLMEGGKYFSDLYIRSKDSKATTAKDADDAGQLGKPGQVRQLAQGESPSSVIFGHGKSG